MELIGTLKMDERWAEDLTNGFIWWASDHAQRVWCDEGVYANATTVYRMHCETDLIRGRGRAAAFELALEREMDHTTLNSLVYDAGEDTYKLHSSVYATEENMTYLKRTCFSAVILQINEAQLVARKLQASIGAVPATSAHPTRGIRTQPDPMLSALEHYFLPMGQHPSRWQSVPEWVEAERAMEREAQRFKSDHHTHLEAEFTWSAGGASRGITLDVNCREPHPVLGNGLHFTLTIPLVMSPERVSHVALELNQYERDNWRRSHMLGSWSCHGGQLSYRSFVPNTVYRPELLPELTLNMAIRAHWSDEFFLEKKRAAEAAKAGE